MPRTTTQPLLRRYRTELVVGVLGLLVVGGLWAANRGDGGDAVTLRPPTSASTEAPEPVADGGDDGPAGTTEVPAPDEDAGELDSAGDSAGAARAVLRAGDLPDGWSRRPAREAGSELCPGQDPFARAPAAGSARAGFRKGDAAFLVGLVADFPDVGAARAFVDAVEAAFAACGGFTTSTVGGVGDEAVLGRQDVDGPESLNPRTRVYVARVGSRVAAVSAVGFGSVDEALARRLLQVQVDRL